MHMRMEQLKYLVDVAESKSMSKTAERLFVTPQAVSQSIKQLEVELDVQLMIRSNMGVSLTNIGKQVVEQAKHILDEEQKMNRLILESKQGAITDEALYIRICSTSAVTNIVLPSILARFKRMNIDIVPRISMVDSLEELLEQVKNGEADIGLLTFNEEYLFQRFTEYQHDLDLKLLARDELVIVLDRHLHQTEQEYITKEEYGNHFRTLYSMTPVDAVAEDAKDILVVRSNDAEFHRAMMKKAEAYVTMPRFAYQFFFSSKSYIALPLEDYKVNLMHAAVYSKNASEDVQKFISQIRWELSI